MRVIIIILFSLLQVGCTSYDFSRKVVQQGNILTQEKIERLKLGMSKEEVTILMGNSLLSTFNSNRWDYAYTNRVGNKNMKSKIASLFFYNNELRKVEVK